MFVRIQGRPTVCSTWTIYQRVIRRLDCKLQRLARSLDDREWLGDLTSRFNSIGTVLVTKSNSVTMLAKEVGAPLQVLTKACGRAVTNITVQGDTALLSNNAISRNRTNRLRPLRCCSYQLKNNATAGKWRTLMTYSVSKDDVRHRSSSSATHKTVTDCSVLSTAAPGWTSSTKVR